MPWVPKEFDNLCPACDASSISDSGTCYGCGAKYEIEYEWIDEDEQTDEEE